jgi:hypothetical protein
MDPSREAIAFSGAATALPPGAVEVLCAPLEVD